MCVHTRPGVPALAVHLELGLVGFVADEVELLEARLEAQLAEGVCDRVGRASGGVAARGARPDLACERLDQVHACDSSVIRW